MKSNFFLFLLLILFGSCFKDENKIRIRTQFISDSLYVAELQTMELKSDSICNHIKNSEMQVIVDSLIRLRTEEITNLRKGL